MRVLVIDDEPQIHRFLRPALEAAGYDVVRADDGATGLRLAAVAAPDLVLLDLGLQDIDGQLLLQRLRAFSAVPVIVISARDRETDKISALDAGADDYLEKPFGVGELLARIRASLRHAGAGSDAVSGFANGLLALDRPARRVRVHGQDVALSRREFALLEFLASHAGKVVTHRQILTALWGPGHVEDVAYLRVYIGQLRRKLGPEAAALIRTEAGIGYRLLA